MVFNIFLLVQVDYYSQIQPIFNSRSISCHGNAADLYLTSYDDLIDGSIHGDMEIPYDHEGSEFWIRIDTGKMPLYGSDLNADKVDIIA